MKRIQDDDNPVVAAGIAPGVQARPYPIGVRIETHEDRVQILVVVAQIDLGTLGGCLAVAGLPLHETGHHGHLAGKIRGRPHVDEILEKGRPAQARDVDGFAAPLGRRAQPDDQAKDGRSGRTASQSSESAFR